MTTSFNDQNQILPGEKYASSTKTNEWLIYINSNAGGGVLSGSNVKNYTDHSMLYSLEFGISRRTTADASNLNQFSSARVCFDNPVIVIPNDIFTPSLENLLITGTIIDLISCKRMTNAGGVNQIHQQVDFKNNLLQTLRKDNDYVRIEFRTEDYTNTMHRRGQDTKEQGQTNVNYNILQSAVTAGGGGN